VEQKFQREHEVDEAELRLVELQEERSEQLQSQTCAICLGQLGQLHLMSTPG